jgi:hypothetical protein
MDSSQVLLDTFDRLPDLLALAKARDPVNVYAVQDQLREKYRGTGQATHWSMPFRHLYQCGTCGVREGEVLHELEWTSRGPDRVRFHESELHRIRQHGDAFPDDVATFLEQVDAARPR